MTARHAVLLGLTLALLVGCAAPAPSASPLTLPPPLPPSAPPGAPAVVTPTLSPAQNDYQAGQAHRAAGDDDAALAAFSRALESEPTMASAYLARGQVHLARQEWPAALADAQTAIALAPDGHAYALLGEVLRRGYGDLSQARQAYAQAVQREPELAAALFPVRWQLAVDLQRPAEMLALAGDYAAAHPSDPLAALYHGQALVALGTPRAAIAELVPAVEETGTAALWFVLGQAYAANGNWSHAITCTVQARALAVDGDPSLHLVSADPATDLLVALGTAYLYSGNCGEARALLEQALALQPQRPALQTLRGRALVCLEPTPTPPYTYPRQE